MRIFKWPFFCYLVVCSISSYGSASAENIAHLDTHKVLSKKIDFSCYESIDWQDVNAFTAPISTHTNQTDSLSNNASLPAHEEVPLITQGAERVSKQLQLIPSYKRSTPITLNISTFVLSPKKPIQIQTKMCERVLSKDLYEFQFKRLSQPSLVNPPLIESKYGNYTPNFEKLTRIFSLSPHSNIRIIIGHLTQTQSKPSWEFEHPHHSTHLDMDSKLILASQTEKAQLPYYPPMGKLKHASQLTTKSYQCPNNLRKTLPINYNPENQPAETRDYLLDKNIEITFDSLPSSKIDSFEKIAYPINHFTTSITSNHSYVPQAKLSVQTSHFPLAHPLLSQLEEKGYHNVESFLQHFLPHFEENANDLANAASHVHLKTKMHPDRPRFFSDHSYDDSIDIIEPTQKYKPYKPHAPSRFSIDSLNSPKLKRPISSQYFNIHSLLASFLPHYETSEHKPQPSPLTFALYPQKIPPQSEYFFIPDIQKKRPSTLTMYLSALPKCQTLPQMTSPISLEATPSTPQISSPPAQIIPIKYRPKKEQKASISIQTNRPLMLRALKYLAPRQIPYKKLFSIESLKLHRSILVDQHAFQNKAQLLQQTSLSINCNEPLPLIPNPLHQNAQWPKVYATQELSGPMPWLHMNYPMHLYEPGLFHQIYSMHLDRYFPIEVFEMSTHSLPKILCFNDTEPSSALKKNLLFFAIENPLQIKDQNLFDLPSFRIPVAPPSKESIIEMNISEILEPYISTQMLFLAPISTYSLEKHLFQLPSHMYAHFSFVNPLSLTTHKPSLTPKNNLAHTLSFLYKIEMPKTRKHYQLFQKKPLFSTFALSHEPHERDLIHSSYQITQNLPAYPPHIKDFIDLLSHNEMQFIPDFTSNIQQYNFDFSQLLSKVRERNRLYLEGLTQLSTLPSLYELNTQILSTEFKTEVEVIAKPQKKGYYFALKFTPYFPDELHRIRQNVFFVIDQSRTISKERFAAFKKAVLRALPYLSPDDTFNVLVFDKHFEKLSSVNMYSSKDVIEKTRRFLENVSYNSLSPPQDYTKIIDYIANTFEPDPSELNVVILLTDGAAYKAHHLQKDKVEYFTKTNQNRFVVHTISAAQHNYLSALDLLSFMNHGTMLHSKSHAALPRQLALLVKKLRYPIATNIHLTLLDSTSSDVRFFPTSHYFQHFYGHQPFVIYGESDSLCEFELMLQGKAEDEWINITQSINLQQALPGDRELLRDASLMENKIRRIQH